MCACSTFSSCTFLCCCYHYQNYFYSYFYSLLLFLFLFHMRIHPYLFNVHLSLHCHAYKVDFPLSFFLQVFVEIITIFQFSIHVSWGESLCELILQFSVFLKYSCHISPVNFKQVYNFIDQLLHLVKETICIIISRIGFFKQSDKSIFEAKGFVLRTCTSLPIYPNCLT